MDKDFTVKYFCIFAQMSKNEHVFFVLLIYGCLDFFFLNIPDSEDIFSFSID